MFDTAKIIESSGSTEEGNKHMSLKWNSRSGMTLFELLGIIQEGFKGKQLEDLLIWFGAGEFHIFEFRHLASDTPYPIRCRQFICIDDLLYMCRRRFEGKSFQLLSFVCRGDKVFVEAA